MRELIEPECHLVNAGLLTHPLLKYTTMFSKTYTSLAQFLQQKPINIIDATRYYEQLGHALGEFVYTVTHPSQMSIHEEST